MKPFEATLQNEPSKRDIDLLSKLGPAINANIKELTALVKMLSDNADILQQINEIKNLINQRLPVQPNILELDKIDNISIESIAALHENLEPILGDKSWVLISKKLKSLNYPKEQINDLINSAINIRVK